jgi:hypothetical protein
MLDNQVFPVRISDVSEIDVDFEWTYSVGNGTSGSTIAELTDVEMSANVALDLFIDADKDKALNSSAASAEIMIWFAQIGTDSFALGQKTGVAALNTTTVAGVDL